MSDRRAAADRAALVNDRWYPPSAEYWVPDAQATERPLRYGDLFRAPASSADGLPLCTGTGEPWHAVMALSPSCELASKAKDGTAVEVARVVPLAVQPPSAARAIVAGWQEKDGRITVAYAHTVFLAGVPHAPSHTGTMFATLKETVRVRFGDLRAAGRIAALDHDARVAVIRRDIYFRYRWLVPMDEIRTLEADRISHDPAFTEPRPPWAPLRAE